METAFKSPIRGPKNRSRQWLAEHRRIITATDSAALLGLDEYRQPADVWLEKTGRRPPFAGNEFTAQGIRHEPMILADYLYRQKRIAAAEGRSPYSVQLRSDLPLYYHADLPFLGATPDAERTDVDRRLVEAKETGSAKQAEKLGEEGTDQIPTKWICQTQTQMAVMGRERCDVAVWLYGKLRIYRVLRNDDLIECIEDAAAEMWERIQSGQCPPVDYQDRRAVEIVNDVYGYQPGAAVQLSQEAAADAEQCKALAEQLATVKASYTTARARLLAAMAGAERGTLPDGRMVRQIEVNTKEHLVRPSTYRRLFIPRPTSITDEPEIGLDPIDPQPQPAESEGEADE